MGKVLNTLSLGLVGGKKKKAAPQEKAADPNPRRDANQATQDAATAAQRGAARARRVKNQVQVGRAGDTNKSGIRTSLSHRPTRSGIGIN